MNMNFNQADLDKINEEALTEEQEALKEEQEVSQESVPESSQTAEQIAPEIPEQTALTTFQTMTVDQSIYATVEPGTAPLIRSSTTTENVKLFNALNGSSESVKNWLGEEIDVIDIVITSADVPSIMGDDESERVSKPCVHFFTLDGAHISSISNGVIRATKMLLACGLTPSEDNPIRIIFKEIDTKRGRAHTFDMV